MSARWIEHNAVNMVPLGNTDLYAQSALQVLLNLLIRSESAAASVSYKAWLFTLSGKNALDKCDVSSKQTLGEAYF